MPLNKSPSFIRMKISVGFDEEWRMLEIKHEILAFQEEINNVWGRL